MEGNALPLQTQIQARVCRADETNEAEETKRGQRRLRIKICGKVWWFGKKQYLCNRKTQDGWPEAITATTTYKRSLR